MLIRLLLLPLACLILAVAPLVMATDTTAHKVLVLNSYHAGYKGSDDLVSGITTALRAQLPRVEIKIEYLDSKNFSGESHANRMLDMLAYKYRKGQFDLLIAADDYAYDLLERHRDGIFGATPVVFCGTNNFDSARINTRPDYSGVNEHPSFAETIELILGLHPNTRRIVAIYDDSETGRLNSADFQDDATAFRSRVAFSSLVGLPMDELLAEVGRLEPDTVAVYFASFVAGQDGARVSSIDALRQVSAASPVPIYGGWEFNLGHGIVGGKLIDLAEHGRVAGRMVARRLQGGQPDAGVVSSPNLFMFDYAQLQRFGIDPSALPSGSTIINQPRSFFERYRIALLASLSVLLLIVALVSLSKLLASQREVRRSRLKFSTIFRSSPDVIAMTDRATGEFLEVNDAFERVIGHTAGEALGRTSLDLGTWESAEARQKLLQELGSKPRLENYAALFRRKNGELFPALLSIEAQTIDEREVLIFTVRDVTEIKKAEEALRSTNEKLKGLFELLPLGIAQTDMQGRYIEFNEAFRAICGYTTDQLKAIDFWALTPHQYAQEEAHQLELLERTGRYGPYEKMYRCQDGRLVPICLNGMMITGADGQRYIWSVVEDISERKAHQQRLEYNAHYDSLTGLPNRVLLADRLKQAMAQSLRRGQKLAVAYLDLDGFKAINDGYGHDAGDRLLSALAERMKHVLRDGDTLARLGGDEFVAVMIDLPDIDTGLPMLSRLLAAAAEEIHDQDNILQVSASLGVTFYPQADSIDADQLLRQADQAMYQAKLAGKNRYHVFDTENDRSMRGHHELLEQIRGALAAHEFVLHYQPKVNMRTGAIVGAEALIRWQHPERGLLSPAAFLPIIANHPLSIVLGEWVLDTAMDQIEAWKAAGIHLPVSVNIDAMHLEQVDFVDLLGHKLALHPSIATDDLELEVLETSALADITYVSAIILACREMGVGFALDDFGTGYSSLTYLKRLPADLLKIDQSFVRDMLDDPEDMAILEGILGLASAFRRRAIAEGVEFLAHGKMLLQLGCELGQGYAIARPMPADEMAGWMATWQPDPAWANCRLISRDDQPVLFAAVEHRSWVAKVCAHLRGERDAMPSLDHHQCRFGTWLDQHGQTHPDLHSTVSAIEPLHQEIHDRARELINLRQTGRTQEAEAGIVELEKLRDRLVEQLMTLLE